MVDVIQRKQADVIDLCVRYRVRRLDVFGSVLGPDYRPGESDIDFLVEFSDMDPYERVDLYFGMLNELRELFGTKVDLVMTGAVKNPYIAADIEATKQLLYAA